MRIYKCQIGLELLHSSKMPFHIIIIIDNFPHTWSHFSFSWIIIFLWNLFLLNDSTMFVSSIRHWWEKCRTINYFVTATIQLQKKTPPQEKKIEIENSFFCFCGTFFEWARNKWNWSFNSRKKIVNMKLIVFTNRYLKINGFLVQKIDRKSFSWVLNFFNNTVRKNQFFYLRSISAIKLLNIVWNEWRSGCIRTTFFLLAPSSASSPINFIKLAPHTLHFSQVEFLCDVACGWIRINKAEKKNLLLAHLLTA